MPKHIKIISLLLSAVLCSTATACAPFNSSNSVDSTPSQGTTAAITAEYTEIQQDYGYRSLISDAQKELYDRMVLDTTKIGESTDSTGKYPIEKIYISTNDFTEADIRIALEAFLMDKPQIFWVDNSFSYINQGGAISVQLYSTVDSSTREKYSAQLESVVKSLIASMPKGLSEFERELYLHDYLLKICEYNKEVTSSSQDYLPFTIFGALINGNAVCEGYAKAMEYLLNKVGVHCITVNGYGKDSLHKWNIVSLEGSWYHLDATWNDTSSGIIYDYFNLDDQQIAYDHTKSDNFINLSVEDICGDTQNPLAAMFNLNVPSCESTEYNYYNQKATKINGIGGQYDREVINGLAAAAKNQNQRFYLQVDSSLDYNQVIEQMFYKYPYKYSDYVQGANNLLNDNKLTAEASFIQKERFNVIEMILAYA